jgi:hypothetical protein
VVDASFTNEEPSIVIRASSADLQAPADTSFEADNTEELPAADNIPTARSTLAAAGFTSLAAATKILQALLVAGQLSGPHLWQGLPLATSVLAE